jgi:hypothetical protein
MGAVEDWRCGAPLADDVSLLAVEIGESQNPADLDR